MNFCCLQLERFLCRECGKVKCTCDTASAVTAGQSVSSGEQEPSCFSYSSNIDKENYNEQLPTDYVEYRNNPILLRQHSDPDSGLKFEADIENNLVHRHSEQPFRRSGENGKLRKSFAVRSREGLGNLLSFTSIRRTQEPNKLNKRY